MSNMLTVYYAGSNMPGYMPDEPPEEYFSFSDAVDAIASFAEQAAEQAAECGDKALEKALDRECEEIRAMSEPFSEILSDGRCYFVSEDEREPEDAREALAAFLDTSPEDVDEDGDLYGLTTFSAEGGEYAVGTEDEADEAVVSYVKDSLWAFNAEFLASQTGLPREVFAALQDRCEGANDVFLELVEKHCEGGIESFAEDAARCDGRGHFLASYDGNENECGDWLIYRVN